MYLNTPSPAMKPTGGKNGNQSQGKGARKSGKASAATAAPTPSASPGTAVATSNQKAVDLRVKRRRFTSMGA